jgi:hypothetical protein
MRRLVVTMYRLPSQAEQGNEPDEHGEQHATTGAQESQVLPVLGEQLPAK